MSGVQSPDASTRYCNVAATQKHLKIWSKDDLDHDHTSFCGVFLMSNNVQIKRFKCERKKFLILTMTKFIFLPAISCYLLKHNLCHTYAVRIVPKVHSNHIWARFLGVSNSRDFWSVWGLFFSSRAYYLIHIYQLFFAGIWQWSHIWFLQCLLFYSCQIFSCRSLATLRERESFTSTMSPRRKKSLNPIPSLGQVWALQWRWGWWRRLWGGGGRAWSKAKHIYLVRMNLLWSNCVKLKIILTCC